MTVLRHFRIVKAECLGNEKMRDRFGTCRIRNRKSCERLESGQSQFRTDLEGGQQIQLLLVVTQL